MCRLWEGGLLAHSTLIDCYVDILFLWDLGDTFIMHQISVHSDSLLLFEKQLKTHTNSSCFHIVYSFLYNSQAGQATDCYDDILYAMGSWVIAKRMP